MNPFRPYKTKHDSIREDTGRSSLHITINLFDVLMWMDCDNVDHKFYDEIPRTEIICVNNNSFYCQISYKEFDNVMTRFYVQYQLIDRRSIDPIPVPDKDKYKGFIQASVMGDNEAVSCIFHKKGYVVTSYEDAVFNCLFKNVTPLN